jgi:hypothetical protein
MKRIGFVFGMGFGFLIAAAGMKDMLSFLIARDRHEGHVIVLDRPRHDAPTTMVDR